MRKEKVLLIVAARGGSRGVKGKNIRKLCGIPLIAHTIRQAKRWGRADRIICSTDSEAIASVAKRYGAEVPFMRPARLAADSSPKVDVLRHALKAVEDLAGERYEIVVDLDATAPIRKVSDIEGAFRLFRKERPKSVFSVVPARKNPYFNVVEVGRGGCAALAKRPRRPITRRQDAPVVYDMNASIYIYDRRYILNEKTKASVSDRSLVFVMDELSAFDIDSEPDFQFLEFLVSKGMVKL